MAMPIRDIPVLKGNDAIEFSKQIEESSKKSITQEELKKLTEAQELFKKLFEQK